MEEQTKDQTTQIETILTNLKNKNFTFYFFTLDTKGNPTAGIANIYEHVKLLTDLGYNAAILHEKNDYRVRGTAEGQGIADWLGEEYASLPHVSIENQQLKDFAAQKSNTLVNFFKKTIKRTPTSTSEQVQKNELNKKFDLLVFGVEQNKLDYKLSNCCNPIPGDDVFGFVTINEGIKVHKKDCPNAISMQSNYAYRIIQAKWIDSSQEEFKAILKITGMDTLGLTNELTKVISNQMSVNIQSISLSSEAGIFNGQVTVVVQNNTILKKLIDNIKKRYKK
jgi:(p)ppGpp synthase/HD superfamily hydrolase